MKICVMVVSLTLLAFVSLYAETPQETTPGTVKSIDCKGGELKIASFMGEELIFRLGKEVDYGTVKSCEEIKEGSMAVVRYKIEDGVKVVSSIKARPPRKAAQ